VKKVSSLKDIASALHVSPSLVSYVLNGHAREKRVSEAVAKKILAFAEKHNYTPNQIAKTLKTKKSHTIGLIVAEIHYRYTTGITRSIERVAKENNYTVIIGNSHEDLSTLSELVNVMINRHVDGLVIVATEDAEKEIVSLKKKGIPFVLIDRNFPKVNTNFIGIDNYQVAYNAVEYLLKQGRRHIAFINYRTSFFHLRERNRGYYQALKEYGIKPGKSLHKEISKESVQEDVRKAILELCSNKSNCDAIFFATDTLAIQGLKNLVEEKVNIPGQIAVISFDESEAFLLFRCPITHYRQPLEEIGEKAVTLLVNNMQNRTFAKQQICLESKLIAGMSCGES
jgi:LacI family transcriptional regulator